MNRKFEEHLKQRNLSENTIASYVWTIDYFLSHYGGMTTENLLDYKWYLMEQYKPKTVNRPMERQEKSC